MQIVKVKFGCREKFEALKGFVYCGREWGGFEASLLANPIQRNQVCRVCRQGERQTLV